MSKISIIIPSRNEKYTTNTIKDLLEKAHGEIEIICVLDGWWLPAEEIVNDPRVIYIHHSVSKGMRASINAGVAIAKGEYILKCDAHCAFAEGFDEVLRADIKDDWVVVPRRYALLPETWTIEDNPKYPVDYMYLTKDLHGEVWTERNKDVSLAEKKIDDLMTAQGSCYFLKKSYFYELELLDIDTYGPFWNEFQEIGFKCWLSGGEVKVNKNTSYSHWHKTEGRGYSLVNSEQEKALEAVAKWREKGWHKQTKPLSWLFEKFGGEYK